MLSSRKTGTNENVQTYGDGTRDFTVLATWEATVDVDTTASGTATTEVLEMYDDSSPYADSVSISGGTHDATYPVIMRAASGHESQWDESTGVRFEATSGNFIIQVLDDFIWIYDIGLKLEVTNASGSREAIVGVGIGEGLRLIGCHIYDCVDSGAGTLNGASLLGDDAILAHCLFADNETNGLSINSGADNAVIYNCTAHGNGNRGIVTNGDNATAINNISDDNGGAEFFGSVNASSGYNASSDATAPGTNSRINQTFTFVSATNFRLGPADAGAARFGKNLATDPLFPFDDDIDFITRDETWDIGGSFLQRSSRRKGTRENIQTYGGGTRDFTALGTWEATVDVDTTAAGTATTEVLELYDDSSPYTDNIDVDGGTHDSRYPLIMRAAVGHENFGSKTTGVIIRNTTLGVHVFDLSDPSVYVHDIGATFTMNAASTFYSFNVDALDCHIIGCHGFDNVNDGAGGAGGIQVGTAGSAIIVNSLIRGMPQLSIFTQFSLTSTTVYNCTIGDGGTTGFFNSSTNTLVRNTISDENTTDFSGTYAGATSHNASGDATAPGSSARTNQAFNFDDDFRISGSDSAVLDFGVDLSTDSIFHFSDDIDKESRPVAPDLWDIGFDEFVLSEDIRLLLLLGVGA